MPFKDPIKKKAYDKSYAEKRKESKQAYDAARYVLEREERIAKVKSWVESNRPKVRAHQSRWRANNRERVKAWARARQQSHLAEYAAQRARRRAAQLRATPAWANYFFLEEAYDLARRRTERTGFSWHVDHIVPLQGKTVCGLHVENNLQVIPGSINRSKGNRVWPYMPEARMGA